jgi:TrmH family RNA methyltransferase
MSLLTTIRDLHRRKARERRGLALAEGVRLVEEMLAAEVACKGAVISPALEETPRGLALVQAFEAHGILIDRVSDRELADLAATDHPQGVVVAYEPRAWSLEDLQVAPGRPLVLLDGVQDPGNVGTIARTAVAFGAAGLVALPGTVDLTNPKVVRSAAGALFRLPHLHADTTGMLQWLWTHSVAVWATTMDGVALAGDEAAGSVALVLGNEGAGISPEVLNAAARRVGIPIRTEAESLNVSVAAGILLHRLGGRA